MKISKKSLLPSLHKETRRNEKKKNVQKKKKATNKDQSYEIAR